MNLRQKAIEAIEKVPCLPFDGGMTLDAILDTLEATADDLWVATAYQDRPMAWDEMVAVLRESE